MLRLIFKARKNLTKQHTKFNNIAALFCNQSRIDDGGIGQKSAPPIDPEPPTVPCKNDYSEAAAEKRLEWVEGFVGTKLPSLRGWWSPLSEPKPEILQGNIEQSIGLARIPTGVAGPIDFRGTHADGLIMCPMAVTEGGVIASTSRGAKAINESGGVSVHALKSVMGRSPVFICNDAKGAKDFAQWVPTMKTVLQEKVVNKKSQHCRITDIKPIIDANVVNLILEYDTGDASGQNMVTSASYAILVYLMKAAKEYLPEGTIEHSYPCSNAIGDKKSTRYNLLENRGVSVVASVSIPGDVIKETLNGDPASMIKYWSHYCRIQNRAGALGNSLNTSTSLAAMFLAFGQDVACTYESSTSYMEINANSFGGLDVQYQLPCLVAGTIGGGTGLPTQNDCLEIVDCKGDGKKMKLAEVITGFALALELATLADVASNRPLNHRI
ncbi:unnamed protein product [Owenia fusiformis]|uniref:Uncharacterized protein n=1 Tax=Owenia fusiformis TaxID=6347 RepID=A0A8J1Y1V4_OWEFU|nr:unnamed protein product [Owenia fusiformis]